MEVFFMSDESKEKKWREIIDACKASGQTIKEWCHLNSVSLDRYHYWKRKFNAEANNKADQNAEWASLIIGDYSSSKDLCSPVILQVASYKIELRDGFSPSVLAAVLKVIHSLC